jgi:DNA gyrase subunit B
LLESHRGERLAHEKQTGPESGPLTILQFVPDSQILSVTAISPAIFTSYFRRLSFLHPGVRFTFINEGAAHSFHSERGLVELFQSVSAPYQILHEPIHIAGTAGDARLEAAFAYHSWTENAVWSFFNNGLISGGGPHEKGFLDAVIRLDSELKLPPARNGIVGVLSVQYPGMSWGDEFGSTVGNKELRPLVCDAILP